jgi:AhpD family alkylhydroperoxidase
LLAALAARGGRGHILGQITGESHGRIVVTHESDARAATEERNVVASIVHSDTKPSQAAEDHAPGCCAEAFGGSAVATSAVESQRAFGALMRSVQAAGALDVKAKELVLFALVLQSRCEACFEAHYERALELGITRAEMDEVAWCAVAMGGAPVKVFYQECQRRFGLG